MPSSFRFLEDIALADIAFEAEGDSPEELFRGATQALIETMADPLTVTNSWNHHLTKTDEELEALLFDWLSEMVYWKDAAGVVFHEAPLTVTWNQGKWTVSGTLAGAPVNSQTQELRNDVKGITRHLYRVEGAGARWRATVVVDV